MNMRSTDRPWVVKAFASDKDGQWYVSIKAANGEVTFSSEGYTTEEGAKRAVERFLDQVRYGQFITDIIGQNCDRPAWPV